MHPTRIPLRTPLHAAFLAHVDRALGHAAAALHEIAEQWRLRRRRRLTRRALQGLDDRTLGDLGLHRSEILSVAHGEHAHERRIRCD